VFRDEIVLTKRILDLRQGEEAEGKEAVSKYAQESCGVLTKRMLHLEKQQKEKKMLPYISLKRPD